ncbi:MAG TPA: FliM/FliN family flagellar motor switch protein [Terracidiphilus sp.]|jgi:flagellar motor switch protein FliN/FliY
MKHYLDCWISTATTFFAQALAGEPELRATDAGLNETSELGFVTELTGDVGGSFTVVLDSRILSTPLHGDGVDQLGAWEELLLEVAEAAAGELLASAGLNCRVASFRAAQPSGEMTHAFQLTSGVNTWFLLVKDELRPTQRHEPAGQGEEQQERSIADGRPGLTRRVELLLDVELEAALRFGCRELPLGEILELGPGDVVELDRHISDPVDLIVGDKIVARGEVVLVNGNFGMRVTDVAEPQKRLESIRCLF